MKISAILPFYKLEPWLLQRCIDSICSQNYKDWECIIVDDGSPERLDLKSYNLWGYDKKFKLIRTVNQGRPQARNTGFLNSTGDLIWFIDPDDYIRPLVAFDKIIKMFKSNDVDIVNFSFYEFTDFEKSESKNKYTGIVGNNSELDITLLNGWRTEWRNVYKRKFLLENKIMHQKYKTIYEDVYWDLLVKTYVKSIYLSDEFLYFYDRRRHTSITNTKMGTKKIQNIFSVNITEAYQYIKPDSDSLFYLHLIYYFASLPYLKDKEIKKNIVHYFKLNKQIKLSWKKKISLFIIRSYILTLFYKFTLPPTVYILTILKHKINS